MLRSRRLGAIVSCLVAVLLLDVSSASAQDVPVYTVSSFNDFLTALGSNRIIEFTPGTYSVPTPDTLPASAASSPHIFTDEWGSSWSLTGLENLTIRGASSDDLTSLLSPDPYATVLMIQSSSNITLENLRLGHEPWSTDMFCTGGVVDATEVAGLTVRNSILFGSGSYAVGVWNCSDVRIENSHLIECTDVALMADAVPSLEVINTIISRHDGVYELISLNNTTALFENLLMEDNVVESHLFTLNGEFTQVTLRNAVINGNHAHGLVDNPDQMTTENVSIDGSPYGMAIVPPVTEGEIPVFEVSTVDELFAAIGSNRTIQLAPGDYALGTELHLSGLSNLRIVGAADPHASAVGSHVFLEDSYSRIIVVESSTNVVLEDLRLGHGDLQGFCDGGVVSVSHSTDVAMNQVWLYGSGAYGFESIGSSNVFLSDSTITGCTSFIALISDSTNVQIVNSTMRNNEVYRGFDVDNSNNVVIEASVIADNQCEDALFSLRVGQVVTVRDSTISGNGVIELSEGGGEVLLEGTSVNP